MNKPKKAILVVSFGTSYEETRRKTIDAIEHDIQAAFPDYKVYRAFTSKMIIKKLKHNYNIKINTVTEALEKILNDGIKELIVQPTHIINGTENDFMIKDVQKYKDQFDSIQIGTPLLTTTEDYFSLIKIISNNFSNLKADEALICMGHGSDHYTNASYPALDYMFKSNGFSNIFLGTVEGYPTIDNVVSELKSFRPKKSYLIPLMIVAGDHATNDMAGDSKDSWKSILEANGFEAQCIVKGLGEYPEVRQLFIEHIKKVI